MLAITGKTINLTRGDSAEIAVTITEADGTAYTPASGDVITFTAKKNYSDTSAAITKTINTSTLTLALDPADTSSLGAGIPDGHYKYDIKLATAGGDVYTFIANGDLYLLPEAH